MDNPSLINICIIKQITTSYPSIFEDSAHCIAHTLKKIGIPNVISYNTIDPTITNIVLGIGAWKTVPIPQFREIAKPNKTIIFNLEQTGSTSDFIRNEYIQLLSDYIILDYNAANIQETSRLAQRTIRGFEFPLAPYFDLKTNPPSKDLKLKYDYAFYGTLNEKRLQKIKQLEKLGLKIKIITNSFGEFLTEAILDCRAVLNLHYYETNIFEAPRALRPTAIGIPIVSEASTLPATVDWHESGVLFIEDDFCTNAAKAIKDQDTLLQLSRKSVNFTKQEAWIENAISATKNTLNELKNS